MNSSSAHPVPRKEHDRTIVVKLTPDAVIVEYRLEVDDWTVVFIDLPAIDDMVDLKKLTRPQEFYEAFTQGYAPIFANNLTATLDGKALTFTCVKREHAVIDHLRCDFVFKADCQLTPGVGHQFRFHEGNYELEPGAIRLSITADSSISLTDVMAPDEALITRPVTERKPGDEARLRNLSVTAHVGDVQAVEKTTPEPRAEVSNDPWSIRVLLDSQHGFVVLLGLALVFGAAHALTPGHGKALVAAYLVGERGTVWHALLLGLVVTITHTGAVLVLAGVLPLFFPDAVPQQVESVLKLVGGLLIAGLGLWLLLRRLAGQADHFHLPGTGHHHKPSKGPVGWWGLVVLGVSGGIVPCWDAVVMLGFAILARQLWLGLPLLVAFSAGLATVLILIGVAVVSAKNVVMKRWGESPGLARIFKLLPIASAVAVMILGFWLCRDSLPDWGQHPPPPIQQPRE